MDFTVYISEILENWDYYLPFLIILVIIYLLVFRKQIWGIFDPLFFCSIMMGCAAFAVLILMLNHYVNQKFILSFILIETAFIIGFKLNPIKLSYPTRIQHVPCFNKITYVFGLILGLITLLLQLYSISKIGIVLFRDDVNHVSVFDGLGPLRAFLSASRTLFIIYFFYKRKINKASLFDWVVFIFIILCILTSGSKSAILTPIAIYFIVDFYFCRKTGGEKKRIKPFVLFLVISFPIIIIALKDGSDLQKSLLLLLARFAGNGDIYVLGYNDSVINNVSDDSFLKYILYPGWGSIFKTIGISIDPPEGIGVNIYRQYYHIYDAGPNTRLPYLLYFFFGTVGGSVISFFFGKAIRLVRESYGRFKHSFFAFFITTILYVNILSIVTDINIFLNNTFWAVFLFISIYIIASLIVISKSSIYATEK